MTHRLTTALLAVAACGLVLAATSSFNLGEAQPPKVVGAPAAPVTGGRYQMITWGSPTNPYLVLLDAQSGQAWSLPLSGAQIWQDLQTPPSQKAGGKDEKERPKP